LTYTKRALSTGVSRSSVDGTNVTVLTLVAASMLWCRAYLWSWWL